jgi:hypothetical protein
LMCMGLAPEGEFRSFPRATLVVIHIST